MKNSRKMIVATFVAATCFSANASEQAQSQVGELRCIVGNLSVGDEKLRAAFTCRFSPFDTSSMDAQEFKAHLRIIGDDVEEIDALRFVVRASPDVDVTAELTGAYYFPGDGDAEQLSRPGHPITLTPATISAHEFDVVKNARHSAERFVLSAASEERGAG